MKNRRFFMAERWFIMALMQWDLNNKRQSLLGLGCIDKGLDVRYMRYCYMAYTEVRSQRWDYKALELRFMFMTKRRD